MLGLLLMITALFIERVIWHSRNLQPNPNVDIAGRDLCRAEENMSAIATWARNLDGVLSAMGCSAVKSDCAALFNELANWRVI